MKHNGTRKWMTVLSGYLVVNEGLRDAFRRRLDSLQCERRHTQVDGDAGLYALQAEPLRFPDIEQRGNCSRGCDDTEQRGILCNGG